MMVWTPLSVETKRVIDHAVTLLPVVSYSRRVAVAVVVAVGEIGTQFDRCPQRWLDIIVVCCFAAGFCLFCLL